MGIKYYTHFVLTGEAAAGSDQEFSGVVEVNQPTELRYETKEIGRCSPETSICAPATFD